MTKKYEDFEKTNRGFMIFGRLKDINGSDVRVQESSLADDYCCFVFTSNKHMENFGPHINVAQAKKLVEALNDFIESKEWRWGESSDEDIEGTQ
jgi:hypothetical protein